MSVVEKDLLLILEYVDGKLSGEEMMALEIRFSNEPELAAAFESFEAMDQLQRGITLAEAQPAPLRLVQGKRHWRPLAAAALLMLTAALLLLDDLWQTTTIDVAAVSSGINWSEFNRELELDEAWIGQSPSTLRGNANSEFSHEDYFEHVAPIQEARLEQALAGELEPEAMVYFNLVLQPEEECSALVLIFDATGKVISDRNRPYEVAFPVGKSWVPDSGRLSGGQLEVLPRRNLVWDAQRNQVGDYGRGFLVPLGSRRLEVLTGLRQERLDNELKKSLDALLLELSKSEPDPAVTESRLRLWLRTTGFEISVTEVVERQD